MFTAEEIRIANATSRSRGASAINKDGSIRAIVPRYIAEHIDKQSTILDYGQERKQFIHSGYKIGVLIVQLTTLVTIVLMEFIIKTRFLNNIK
jgi:hypothetical protein